MNVKCVVEKNRFESTVRALLAHSKIRLNVHQQACGLHRRYTTRHLSFFLPMSCRNSQWYDGGYSGVYILSRFSFTRVNSNAVWTFDIDAWYLTFICFLDFPHFSPFLLWFSIRLIISLSNQLFFVSIFRIPSTTTRHIQRDEQKTKNLVKRRSRSTTGEFYI